MGSVIIVVQEETSRPPNAYPCLDIESLDDDLLNFLHEKELWWYAQLDPDVTP